MLDKGAQIVWNTTVGLVFLGVIAVTMAAKALIED
tara:strand:+ start:3094 stop:3198 length:105 start_codon:yes stop_codon:yes gene_type:complete